jgi:transposase
MSTQTSRRIHTIRIRHKLDELPVSKDCRWNIKRKHAVVEAVETNELSLNEALDFYGLTEQEYARWKESYKRRGIANEAAREARH